MANDDPWLGLDDPVPTARPAAPVYVFRSPGQGAPPEEWDYLDNVACEWVEQGEGTDPGHAGFRYRFTGRDPDAPQSIEDALSADYRLPKTIVVGDELVVVGGRPDGVEEYLFHGYAADFGMALGAAVEAVDFVAVGVAWTLWDSPIDGAYLRDASDMGDGNGYQSSVVARFNPKGKPNCVAKGGERTINGWTYPVFVDPLLDQDRNGLSPRLWKLPDAAKYLIYHHNHDPQAIVQNPAPDLLDQVLVAREPADPSSFDPADESTYTKRDLFVQDKPITGHGWPDVLWSLISDKGFGMCFRTGDGGSGPATALDVFVQQAGDLKDLYLPQRGSYLDPRWCNLGPARVVRQTRDVISQWTVEGGLCQYEASFILYPLYAMDAKDGANFTAIRAYDLSNPQFNTANHDAYRLYGADELGLGWYAPGSSTKKAGDGSDFSPLFGTKDFAARLRPALAKLITTDPGTGQPLRPRLDYATDYDMTKGPGLWDGSSGTWNPVSRGWRLRPDMLGIWISCDNPNHWTIGEDPSSGSPIVVKGVESQCKQGAGNFVLRLTCVVEGDDTLRGFAAATVNSPFQTPIERRIDARDRYLKQTVAAGSLFNASASATVPRDDTDAAKAEAVANRTATECGILDGEVVIPYLTTYYAIGDRIGSVNGRGLALRTDGAGSSGYPVYPRVVRRRLMLGDRRHTVLELSDAASDRPSIERKARRK